MPAGSAMDVLTTKVSYGDPSAVAFVFVIILLILVGISIVRDARRKK